MQKFYFFLIMLFGCSTVFAQNNCDAEFTYTWNGLSYQFHPADDSSGATHHWDMGDGTSSTATSPSKTYAQAATYFIKHIITRGNCADTVQHYITAGNEGCNAEFTYQQSGSAYHFTSYNTNPGIQHQWQFLGNNTYSSTDANPVMNLEPGYYYVEHTVTNPVSGCSNTNMLDVYVNGNTNACNAEFTITTVADTMFTFTANQTGTGFQHLWNFGDGTTNNSATVTHDYTASGTYTIMHIIWNSAEQCADTAYQTILVQSNEPCDASFGVQNNNNLYYFSSANPNAAVDHHWNFGDGSTGTGANPEHTYSTPGGYTVTHIVWNGTCSDTVTQTVIVIVDLLCDATIEYTGSGDSYYFYAPNAGSGLYHWDFGDGNTSNQPSEMHVYPNPGTYTISLIFANANCSDTSSITVTATTAEPCSAIFGYNNTQLTYTFFPSNVIPSVNHSWTFGDGNSSAEMFPIHTYSEPGVYTVTHYTNTANCADTAQIVINATSAVDNNCYAPFTYTNDGNTYQFTGSNNYPNQQHVWYFGDGNTSNDAYPAHSYAAGTYTVTHIVFNAAGCTDTSMQTITVVPLNCNAEFSHTAGPNTISFYPVTTQDYGHLWSFGDGSSSGDISPSHTYLNAGSYTVMHIIWNANCSDTSYATIQIAQDTTTNNCYAPFTYTHSANIYQFHSAANYPNQQHFWNFGDGSTSDNANPTHEFTLGTYTVQHIVHSNNCTDTSYQEITVLPQSVCDMHPTFYWTAGNIPGAYFFSYTDSLLTMPTDSVRWNFGDNTGYHYGQNVDHQFAQPGTYNVCIRVVRMNGTTPCVRELCSTIVVTQTNSGCQIVPSFVHNANGQNVHFENTSSAGGYNMAVTWNFGDGTTATGSAINHYYTQPGNYQVCIAVVQFAADSTPVCSRDTCLTIQVAADTTQPGICAFQPTIGYQQSPNSYTYAFYAPLPNPTANDSIIWHIGNAVYYGNQISHTFSAVGAQNVCLIVKRYNAAGALECVKDTCISLNVTATQNPNPCNLEANFSYSHVPNAAYNIMSLSATNTEAGDIVTWMFNDSTTATGHTVQHQFNSNSNVVCMQIQRNDSCIDQVCKPVIINAMGDECSVQVYPNPTNSLINGALNLPQAASIITRVINTEGVIVRQLQQAGIAGGNTVTINVANLPAGLYRISFNYLNRSCSRQFFKY